MMDTAQVTANW